MVKLNKLMVAAIVLSFASMITTTAYAGWVTLRNCTTAQVDVKAYPKNDPNLTRSRPIVSIAAGAKEKLSCGTDMCIVVIGTTNKGTYDNRHYICSATGNISNLVPGGTLLCANEGNFC